MSFLTVNQFYEKYPNTRFFMLAYYTDEIENAGLCEKELYVNPKLPFEIKGIIFISQHELYHCELVQHGGSYYWIDLPIMFSEVFFTGDALDAKIYEYSSMFLCDKCILSESIEFNPFICDIVNEEFYKKIISKKPLLINFIKEQTDELCKIAVGQFGIALKYIINKTPELCKIAVNSRGIALEFVPEELQTEEICKIAVKENGYALKFVHKQFKTPELYNLVKQNDY